MLQSYDKTNYDIQERHLVTTKSHLGLSWENDLVLTTYPARIPTQSSSKETYRILKHEKQSVVTL